MSEKIAEVFNVEPHEVKTDVEPVVISGDSVDDDFAFARANYYELITQGQAAMNTAMRIAAESENPRAIEVLSGLLKNMADVNRQLIQMSKDREDVKAVKSGKDKAVQQIGSVQNAVFVGSSADLNKMLAERMKNEQT